MDAFDIDGLRLKACFALLRSFSPLLGDYILPKTKFRSHIGQLLGHDLPNIQHMLVNASVKWYRVFPRAGSLAYADAQRMSSFLTTHQFRAITSPSVDIDALLQKCPTLIAADARCEPVETPDCRGHYVPRYPNATHIILYIHGGGFNSGSPGAVSAYLLQLSHELLARGVVADVFAAGYDLAPEYPYPHALKQIVCTYNHLRRQNKPIVLAGDSAGGNLSLALLRHLASATSQPQHESLRGTDVGSTGIIAAHLFSPWVDLRNDSESFKRNAGKDCLDKSALDRWRDAYLAGQPEDEYTSPANCTTGWIDVLPPKTMFITGELDLFVSDILHLARSIEKDGYRGLDVHVAPKKGHVWNLIDFGGTQPGTDSSAAENENLDSYIGVGAQADWIARHCLDTDE